MASRNAVRKIEIDDLSNISQNTLEPGQQKAIYFTVQRDRMAAGSYQSLLKLSGNGVCFYIPVSAIVKHRGGND